MKYVVNLLATAFKDLDDIEFYYDEKLKNKEAYGIFYKKFRSSISLLSFTPYMYKEYDRYEGDVEFRMLVIKKYLIFYYIDESNKEVNIARVIYSKREYDMELTTTILQEESVEYTTK